MRFENQTFENTEVTFDYNQFVNCTFRDVTIMFHGGDWSLAAGCRFAGTVKFVIGGPANNTMAFLKWVRQESPDAFESLMKEAGLTPVLPASTRPS